MQGPRAPFADRYANQRQPLCPKPHRGAACREACAAPTLKRGRAAVRPVISEGERAPAFSAPDADGRRFGSRDLKGRRYAVYFYPKDFTPGCTTEAGEFARDYPAFKEAGVEVVGVSPDDPASHRRFCDKMGVGFPVLADTDAKIAGAFGVWGKKKFMGREYTGVLRSTFLVDEKGVVFKVFPKVRPAGHAGEVLAAFKAK